MSQLIPVFLLTPLRECTRDRRDRADAGLADGSFKIEITRQDESELRAIVTNGDGIPYAVVLREGVTLCTCHDSLYQGTICKHAIAVCLTSLQHDTTDSRIHLLSPDDRILCGHEFTPQIRFWKRWSLNALNWSDLVCQPCISAWQHPEYTKAAA